MQYYIESVADIAQTPSKYLWWGLLEPSCTLLIKPKIPTSSPPYKLPELERPLPLDSSTQFFSQLQFSHSSLKFKDAQSVERAQELSSFTKLWFIALVRNPDVDVKSQTFNLSDFYVPMSEDIFLLSVCVTGVWMRGHMSHE